MGVGGVRILLPDKVQAFTQRPDKVAGIPSDDGLCNGFGFVLEMLPSAISPGEMPPVLLRHGMASRHSMSML
jgi:hypothetical protein